LIPRCEKSPSLLIPSVKRAIFDRRSNLLRLTEEVQ
jgi:hypothetical protein